MAASDPQPVFDLIAESATKLCGGEVCTVTRFDGEWVHLDAIFGSNLAGIEALRRTFPMQSSDAGGAARAIHQCAVVQIPDVRADPHYKIQDAALVSGFRALLAVPMLREGHAIGAITVGRAEAGLFSDMQVQLLGTFAAQAVIAIENTRLLNVLRQRTDDLSEALEQQTATSEVLGVISSSPGELEPVFQTMLANAVRICDAKFGTLYRSEGDALRVAAMHNAPLSFIEERRRNPAIRPRADSTLGRALVSKKAVQIADAREEPEYPGAPSGLTGAQLAKYAGARTVLAVPMLKENQLIGAIIIFRQEVRPFTDKQVELVENFAAQAVIAIENTRLLNELRESLENQPASADILRAIASSPAKTERALDVIAETTARRFEASNVNIRLLDGNILRYVGSAGPTAEHMQAVFPEGPPDANTTSGKAILERRQTYLRGDDVPVSS